MFSVHQASITKAGQMSVPASIRHRWKARKVAIVDRGDHFVVTPVPDDPVSAFRGSFAGPGPTTEEARRLEREEEAEREDRRFPRGD